MQKVGIIGAGKVGTSLGLHLFKKGDLSLTGFYSKSLDSARYSARLTKSHSYDSLDDLVANNQILIITTPDDSIKNIWSELQKFNIEGKIVCHCSGSLSSSIFFDCTAKKVHCCSFHPMLAISSKEEAYKTLGGAFFTLEGDVEALDVICRELDVHGNPYKVINSKDKRKYHLATVFISNLVVGLADISINLMKDYDFTEDEALQALSNLGKKNLDNIFSIGTKNSLTGPIERNDLATIRGHLSSIDGENYKFERKIYRDLSQYLVKIASEKNPDRDYSKITNLLKKGDTD